MLLLEREALLAALAGYAQEAQQGDGRLVLVAGEAGVGKSALVEGLQQELSAARWSWGACDGLFTPLPLGPLFDVAEQLGGELLELCHARAAREELFGALLRQINVPGTLHVVVMEDMHWADEASVDLFRYLSRRIRSVPALLVATYRDDELTSGDPLRMVLGEVAAQRSTRRITLAPLSAEAVRILAGDSGVEPAELYRLTGGNPFYVTEVVQAGAGEVPPSARDAVLARAARLGRESREVLDLAALAGSRVELRLLRAATHCSEAVIDDLLESGLLAGDEAGLRFRHEIARRAVAEAVAPHRRRSIHGRILEVLRCQGCDDDARMAFHAEGAGDDPAVLHHAVRAGRRAAELASHREAAAHFERALGFAAGADPAMVAGLHLAFAGEASVLDRWDDVADAYEQAMALWSGLGDRLRVGDTMSWHARAMWHLCRGTEAVAGGDAALATLEPLGPTPELAWAYANRAQQRMLDGEHDAAVETAHRAQGVAESLGLTEVYVDALNTEGGAAACGGWDWLPIQNRAMRIATAEGLDVQIGRAFITFYIVHCSHREFAEAEPYFADGVAFCDERDLGGLTTALLGERTSALEKVGRWDESVSLSAEMLSRAHISPVARIKPLASLGTIRARRGEAGVWECLDEAMDLADGTAEPFMMVAVRLARAEAWWLAGTSDAARHEVELADDVSATVDAWVRGAIGVWLRRTGSIRSPHDEVADPYRLQLRKDWTRAAAAWTALGCPYDAAMALSDGAEEATLREGLRIFQALGATAAERLTRQRMRQVGIRSIPTGPNATTRTNPMQLTRRERDVLDLVCRGKTNAEIAKRLFISPKTVGHHVSAVLAKLDVPTRRAAAAEAARLGLVVELTSGG
jgi:DNA-binding CsgD family transcriptional regulator